MEVTIKTLQELVSFFDTYPISVKYYLGLGLIFVGIYFSSAVSLILFCKNKTSNPVLASVELNQDIVCERINKTTVSQISKKKLNTKVNSILSNVLLP